MDQLVLTLEFFKYSMTLRCFVSEGLAVFTNTEYDSADYSITRKATFTLPLISSP